MVLVDSSVWIDFLTGLDTPHADELAALVKAPASLCTCGLIVTEVLQGIRDQHAFERTRERFTKLTWLPMEPGVFIGAADLYRRLKRRGITIRNTVDPLIAVLAMTAKAEVLHRDEDFERIAKYSRLKIHRVPAP